MAEEIINRVANSKLVTIDLEDYYPEGSGFYLISRIGYMKVWFCEKKISEKKPNHSTGLQYQNCYVSLTCSTEAIIPAWAYMLLVVYLEPFVEKVIIGDLDALETSIYQDIINQLDTSEYRDKPVIIKGCSHKPVPANAYVMLINKLKPLAKSIMYGEACSAVPLYKKR